MALEDLFSCLRDEFALDGAVQFQVFVTGRSRVLKPAIQEQTYLIGREALINAFRHAQATRIEAEVQYRPRDGSPDHPVGPACSLGTTRNAGASRHYRCATPDMEPSRMWHGSGNPA